MNQGRQSKTVLMLGCVLAALGALVAFAPAASAQTPAQTEYDLGPLPGADDGGTSARQSPSDGVPVGAGPSGGGGGGGPLLLIVLAAVAAVCTGLAVWRLRGGSDDEPPSPSTGPGSSTGERQSA